MNKTVFGNGQKLIAIALIVVVLLLITAIVAGGWKNNDNEIEDGENVDNTPSDNIPTGTPPAEESIPQEPQIPEFLSYLTGLEVSGDVFNSKPYAFVMDTSASIYGISDSDLVFELPTENGNSRFLAFSSDISALGKIGALLPTRDYITALTKFYGGILVANGCDDLISYDSPVATLHLDISKYKDYTYTENAKNIYTSADIISELTGKENIDTASHKITSLPYEFCEYGGAVVGKTAAASISVPYSSANTVTLNYNPETQKYVYSKNGKVKNDMLSGDALSFTNAFVLFSDTVTYEKASGVEMVTEVHTSGTGYYASLGKLDEIRWTTDKNGELKFYCLDGKTLVVNRGNSYFSYYKSSDSQKVTFE